VGESTLPADMPPNPQLPEGSVDTPLVRVYNFLRKSLQYQLALVVIKSRNDVVIIPVGNPLVSGKLGQIIDWFCFYNTPPQAERLRSLGWADYLKVEMINHRKTLHVSYWVYVLHTLSNYVLTSFRRLPQKPVAGRSTPMVQRNPKLPSFGGKIKISIVETSVLDVRSAKQRVLDDLELKAKLGGKKPSDKVESLKIVVSWEGSRGTLGVTIPDDVKVVDDEILNIVSF
jgi:mediator of RNA polymerase II transcription subunit 14